jgi:RNA polymerase sigma factor (sigma-70 family)
MGLMAVMLQRLVGRLRHWADPVHDRAPTDRQLLQRFAVGRDEAAFAELVRRHGPMVLSVARRVLQNAHDAEDVAQAVFLVLAQKAATVRWQESISGWLFPVVRHLALKVRGRRERRRDHEARIDPAPVETEGTAADELRAVLDEELGRLPDHYREVIVLCYLEGRTQKEAAEQLGLSPGEVRGRLDRARERLRDRLRRRGWGPADDAVASLPAPPLLAALSSRTIDTTTRAALSFTARTAADGLAAAASPRAVALATGALHAMRHVKIHSLFLAALTLGALVAATLSLAGPPRGDDPTRPFVARADDKQPRPAQKGDKGKPKRHCIILWMSGGPSQFDTFDLKPGDPNGGNAVEIETAVKGIKISENLPKLAKLTDQLAIIRSLTHDDLSHNGGTYLMRRGRRRDDKTSFPPLGALLAKELSDGKLKVPPYVSVNAPLRETDGGFLPHEFAPLAAEVKAGADPKLPSLEAFERLNKDRAGAMRKGVEKAFDLADEKKAVHDAYGATAFGQGCLLARRLVERGVPVVEVTLGGWDTHARNEEQTKKKCEVLDPAFAALLRDLKERKLLDRTLIVWMGEFGRTPRINAGDGRDHWGRGFSVVLGGAGIKGGQVIGKTSDDGTRIDETPVTPAELHATIVRALGLDPKKENKANTGEMVPLVEDGAKPVKEALK